MKKIEWDLLQPQDIEVRIGNKIKDTDNVTMLLYQDSRCTARNLDKQFGQFGWSIDYKVVGEQIYGTLSIYDESKQQWVSKSDTGDKSNISEDKGQSSDILKRCAVRWGFGTELYTAPRIVLPNDGYGNSGYKVSEINYNNNREIIHLVIVNRFDKEVYRWDMNKTTNPATFVQNATQSAIDAAEKVQTIVEKQIENKTLENELKQFVVTNHTEENSEQIKKFYNYYTGKIKAGWKGKMDIPTLWNKWTQPKAS